MAQRKFEVDLNLQKHSLNNARIQNLASDPSTPAVGQAYFNTATNKIRTYNGATWDEYGSGGAGATNITQTLTATTVAINSDTGTDATIAAADGTNAGIMTSAQSVKLAGIATSATANSADATLLARANHTGTQTAATISDFSTAADARITAAKGVANGIASLGADSKVPTSQLPAISLTNVQTAASQVAQLALTTQEGDVVVRTDENKTYMRNAGVAGTMADFTLLNTPTDVVTSVNSQTGVVVLAKADVGLANVDNTSDANKPVSTAQATADGLRALKSSNLSDLASVATAFSNIKQAASDTVTGVVELATVAEAQAKTDTTRALTAASVADFARKVTGTYGDAAAVTFAITHGLNSQWPVVAVYEVATGLQVEVEVTVTSATVVTLVHNTAPTLNQFRYVIVG